MTVPSQKIPTLGVIVGLDLVGDALIKLPFLRALRNAYPEAQIHYITTMGSSAFGGILRKATVSLIDRVEERPGWYDHPQSAPFFDLLIDTRNRWRLALEARRLPHGVFLASAMRFLFSDRRPSLFQPRPAHLGDRLLQFVELAAGYKPVSTGALPVADEFLQKARQILPEGRIYVGLAPGCSDPVRMWPRHKFEKIARQEMAKGHTPVFILGPQEQSWHHELASAMPEAIFPLQEKDVWGTPQISLDQTLAIGLCLDMAVTNDSGPGHILAAVDCPVLSLFGPTTPLKAAPRCSRGRSIRAQDFGSGDMKAIPWEMVDRTIDEMLVEKRR